MPAVLRGIYNAAGLSLTSEIDVKPYRTWPLLNHGFMRAVRFIYGRVVALSPSGEQLRNTRSHFNSR